MGRPYFVSATVLFYIVATIFHMDTQQMLLLLSIASLWNVLGLTMSFISPKRPHRDK